MSKNARRFRSVVVTVLAVAATNAAIAFASGIPLRPESPRPVVTERDSGIPVRPEAPRPRTSGIPVRPEAPRP